MAHTHHHHPEPGNYNLAFALAVGLNGLFVIIQVTYALIANSMSLLADAIHNLGDVVGLVLAWGAHWLQSRNAGERYSYGFKKTTVLAALLNAILLVSTAAVIGYESISNIIARETVNENIVMVVALIGIVINSSTALLFMKGSHHDLNIKGAFLHLMIDALISFGVVIGAAVILFSGWEWLDPVIGLAIVLVILWSTWGLLQDSVNLILDAVPRHIDLQAVKAYLCSLPGVKGIHDLHIWGLSTKEVALTAHLIMPDRRLEDAELKKITQTLSERFKIHHPTLQVEQGQHEHPCERTDAC